MSTPKERPTLTPFDLYELCVTDAPRLARFLAAVHARAPRTLREDFSGTGALARAWARLIPKGHAAAVDRDPEPLARCRNIPGITPITSDVLRCRARADIIAATNFPIGYWHDRAALLRYLKHARRCLNPRGVFVCDTYGGADAFSILKLKRTLRGPNSEHIEQTWEQRDADPLTAKVTDVLHFRVRQPRASRARLYRDAFIYRWRLWSIPELREAMLESGFRAVDVYDRLGDAIDSRGRLHARPVSRTDHLDENYVVYVAGRA